MDLLRVLQEDEQARHRLRRGARGRHPYEPRRGSRLGSRQDRQRHAGEGTRTDPGEGSTQAYGRSITSSEYRHAQKVKATAPDKINFYSEIDAPVAPPVVMPAVAGPAPKKKKWYKPWTWLR